MKKYEIRYRYILPYFTYFLIILQNLANAVFISIFDILFINVV
nr:MAG TPA: hypothetical protein [Caudoviricetes sp.]